ncbi:transcriptional regulator, RpiR family [Thermosinus carboxydivorans Nor1]|uniref:Transcriptional regulator, RpiR family n=1 Tax=Thermosinus carboxydivorans Nor1 TaxID=401526 RepID=A1HM41_9FIRM|nr:MurR/RpiR family transcriptional regulator [Thermosinus carboxydivorans]EAX48892.1 transcriptional regulator, RpiR family [Thermosinus carboxydivorans Nor1]
MNNLFSHIRTKYHTLSPTQKQIADFVLKNSEEVMLLSISDFAERCNTSETTILRFLRKLGFDSYQVFRVRIAQDASNQPAQAIYEEIQANDSLEQIRQKVITSTVNSIQDLNNLISTETIERVCELMINADQILFFGVGASSAIAMDAFHKFIRLGLKAAYLSDTHYMSIACNNTTCNSVVFAVSHSGESRDILDAVDLAKDNKANIIALTSYAHSSLAKRAQYSLLSSSNETKYRSDAMVSRILQLVIVDILYVTLVLKLGQSAVESVNRARLAVAKKKV